MESIYITVKERLLVLMRLCTLGWFKIMGGIFYQPYVIDFTGKT